MGYVIISNEESGISKVSHVFYRVGNRNKIWALSRIIDNIDHNDDEDRKILVFTCSDHSARKIDSLLGKFGYSRFCPVDRGDTPGTVEVLGDFDDGNHGVAIITDRALDGPDFQGICLAVNYDVPKDPALYRARAVKVGFGEGNGKIINLVSREEMHYLVRIRETLDMDVGEREVPPLPEGKVERTKRFFDPDEMGDLYGMVTFSLELGRNGGVNTYDMFNLIGKLARCRDDAIGDITIDEERTCFQIHKSHAHMFLNKEYLRFKTRTARLRIVRPDVQ